VAVSSKLFAIERKLVDCKPEERREKRQELAKPILDDLLSIPPKRRDSAKRCINSLVWNVAYWKGDWISATTARNAPSSPSS